MNVNGQKFDLPNGINILATLFSPVQSHMGVLIAGEDYETGLTQPAIRIYLIALEEDEWFIEDELEAFVFGSYESAKRFVNDIANMSAIDLLLLMNGYSTSTFKGSFVQ